MSLDEHELTGDEALEVSRIDNPKWFATLQSLHSRANLTLLAHAADRALCNAERFCGLLGRDPRD